MDEIVLSPNDLAFIALTNEYCQIVEQAADFSRHDLIDRMLKLLPRIYISARDLDIPDDTMGGYIEPSLEEATYDQGRETIARVMEDEDIYLEVFMDDMRYSDTPISASISENLADLYQEFYNFVHAIQDAPTYLQTEMLTACGTNFREYWGQTLCNVLRALHCVNTHSEDY